jgi:hypothetical protein
MQAAACQGHNRPDYFVHREFHQSYKMQAKYGPWSGGLNPVASNTTLITARDCLSMPLNMKLSFAHSNVAVVEGA